MAWIETKIYALYLCTSHSSADASSQDRYDFVDKSNFSKLTISLSSSALKGHLGALLTFYHLPTENLGGEYEGNKTRAQHHFLDIASPFCSYHGVQLWSVETHCPSLHFPFSPVSVLYKVRDAVKWALENYDPGEVQTVKYNSWETKPETRETQAWNCTWEKRGGIRKNRFSLREL